ncbi:MAG: restriction endonuclease subunit S [bacterium]|nr:restriction endonuclease subunit S [bacterium]
MTLRADPAEIVAESSSPLLGIHDSWERVPLGEVVDVKNGATFKSAHFNGDGNGIPLIRIRDVGKEGTGTWYSGPYEEDYLVDPGDLLVGMDGDFRVARWPGPQALLNQRVCRLRVRSTEHYDHRFLEHVLQGYLDAVHQVTSSVTVKHLSSRTIQALPIPLPPREEQRRIVNAIEELLTRIDAAMDDVGAVRRKVPEVTRGSIHRALLGGGHPGESPEGELPPIPSTWEWLPLPEVGDMARGKSRHRPRNDPSLFGGRYPFVQTGDVGSASGYLTAYSQTYSEKGLEQSRLWPEGTVCITIAANIADSAILAMPACFPDSVVGIIVDPEVAVPEYVELFIRTAKSDLEMYAPATAQKNINLRVLSDVLVPVPSVAEQRRIVQEVARVESGGDTLMRSLDVASVRGARLRTAILADAFAGRLVSQDPNDEPAEVLLDRIAVERAAQKPTPRKRKKKVAP